MRYSVKVKPGGVLRVAYGARELTNIPLSVSHKEAFAKAGEQMALHQLVVVMKADASKHVTGAKAGRVVVETPSGPVGFATWGQALIFEQERRWAAQVRLRRPMVLDRAVA